MKIGYNEDVENLSKIEDKQMMKIAQKKGRQFKTEGNARKIRKLQHGDKNEEK